MKFLFKHLIFNLLTLGFISDLHSASEKILNYSDPTYSLKELPSGLTKINVDVKIETDLVEKIEVTRERILNQEANKSSLFAMAFIQKLAMDQDAQALDIRSIYQAYRQFIETSDKIHLKKACQKIIDDPNTDLLARNFALIITGILNNQPLDPSLQNSLDLLAKLIPGIEQTLTMTLPQKIYAEQEVSSFDIEGTHKAFPDLIKYNGEYYASFREGSSHASYNDLGKIRLLKGTFNEERKAWKWETVALLSSSEYDLRDPRFFVDGNNTLKMIMGGSKINEKDETAERSNIYITRIKLPD